MLGTITKNGRWKDYLNFRESEVKIAILLSILVLMLFEYLEIYNNMILFDGIIIDILLCLIGGFIGLIGFALSGIAIMIGLFSKKQINLIEQNSKKGILEQIMSSFAFLALNVAINVFVLIVVLLLLSSNRKLVSLFAFVILLIVISYFTFFNIFYTVSLVFNCITCFSIKNIYDRCESKDFFDEANEIRIDFILSIILKINDITEEQFIGNLEEAVKKTDTNEQKDLIDYFYKFYTGKSKSENVKKE